MSTHIMFLWRNKKIFIWIPLLSQTMHPTCFLLQMLSWWAGTDKTWLNKSPLQGLICSTDNRSAFYSCSTADYHYLLLLLLFIKKTVIFLFLHKNVRCVYYYNCFGEKLNKQLPENGCSLSSCLTLITLWAHSADDKLVIFFFYKIGSDISCKLSPILFSRKNKKKYFKMLSAEIFTQHTKC